MENTMNALQKNIATARGESLAASLLASVAIRTAFAIASNKEALLSEISAFVDRTLNLAGPNKGDPNDEFSTLVRETARFQVMQHLDAIEHMLKNRPTQS
jgi:hypothetical protein